MTRRLARLRARLAEERGFTLIELLTALSMLVIVVTALSAALVSAGNAERDMNRRFGSQINARLALDMLRREVHCAASVTGAADEIQIVLGNRCPTAAGGTTVRWCAEGSGTRYALYRQLGASCSTSGAKRVDYLTTNALFAITASSSSSLAYVTVTLPVNTNPASGRPDYRLTDDIVLRNSTRS
ncbi:MAG TPA: prepilin-type N-terminal cleavage/methylation domain-containing protein [Gaiellaceae bacterium]|nr:prepilin-type N-terminal cleavage/methylation domain-containing protein [Gaiellaceae bacterium]